MIIKLVVSANKLFLKMIQAFIENDDYFYYHFINESIRTSTFNKSKSKSVLIQDAYNPEILNCKQKIKNNCEDLRWNPNNNLTDDMIDIYLGRIKSLEISKNFESQDNLIVRIIPHFLLLSVFNILFIFY
jgi:hypothetical protein